MPDGRLVERVRSPVRTTKSGYTLHVLQPNISVGTHQISLNILRIDPTPTSSAVFDRDPEMLD